MTRRERDGCQQRQDKKLHESNYQLEGMPTSTHQDPILTRVTCPNRRSALGRHYAEPRALNQMGVCYHPAANIGPHC